MGSTRRRSATTPAAPSPGRTRRAYRFGANEVPDVDGAVKEIETYLEQGAVVIAEQKFGVDCDSPGMQRIYEVAEAHHVPVLMHWQFQMYNFGFERFHRMLEKYPRVNFIGHAQTWWANIDRNQTDQTVLYPKGPVVPGGLTDRYLSDYPNMYGDLSAGSGLNALTRDEDFARDFLTRHRDRLLFGSDCNDRDGGGSDCLGARIIATVRRCLRSLDGESCSTTTRRRFFASDDARRSIGVVNWGQTPIERRSPRLGSDPNRATIPPNRGQTAT